MSARSRYLLQRDVARESTDIGKKAAQASDYLAREKTSSQIGGSLGAYAGVQLAGLIAGGPITWGAAAVAAGLGYLVGGKAGEEISERKESGQWMIGKEDKYSNEQSGFHRELKDRGRFLKEDRKLTSESLMEAKKGTDLWGGIGKGALMASATAGIKYGAVDDLKTKIKAGKFSWMLPEVKEPAFGAGNLKDAGKITKEGAEYENMLDKINKAKPPVIDTIKDASNPRVIAGRYPGMSFDEAMGQAGASGTLADKVGLAEGRDEVISGMKLGGGYASGTKHPPMVGGVLQTPTEQITDAVSSGLNEGAEEFVEKTRAHAHSKGGLYKAVDDGATTQFNPYGVTPEMEKSLTTRGQEEMYGMPISDENLAGRVTRKVTNTPDVPAYDQSGVYAQGNDGLVDKYQTGSKTVDLKGDYLSKFGETRNPTKAFENLEAGFAGDIPEELAYSPEELKRMKNAQVQSMWDTQKSDMGIDKPPFSGGRDFAGKTKATINEYTPQEIDYNKTIGQDLAKSQNLKGATDVSVNPASVGNAHQQAISQFYDPALTAPESWGKTVDIAEFKKSSIYSSLPGKTASNKYYNWHNTVSKAWKAQ